MARAPSSLEGRRQGGSAMCQIFAGQDPINYECETRSIRIDGHVTSIRLEHLFWNVL